MNIFWVIYWRQSDLVFLWPRCVLPPQQPTSLSSEGRDWSKPQSFSLDVYCSRWVTQLPNLATLGMWKEGVRAVGVFTPTAWTVGVKTMVWWHGEGSIQQWSFVSRDLPALWDSSILVFDGSQKQFGFPDARQAVASYAILLVHCLKVFNHKSLPFCISSMVFFPACGSFSRLCWGTVRDFRVTLTC